MPITEWAIWGVLLVFQNFAFTFVSRARNSGSLQRHLVASIFSNGIWFITMMFSVSTFMNILTGKYGWHMAVFAGVYYTTFTIIGSISAHYWALHNEKGKAAVGANKKYAQITTEEWEQMKRLMPKVKEKGAYINYSI